MQSGLLLWPTWIRGCYYIPWRTYPNISWHLLNQSTTIKEGLVSLTRLIGGDGNRSGLIRPWALWRHAVDRPHLKSVVCVCLQLIDRHSCGPQAKLLGGVMDGDSTRLAPLSIRAAPFTHDVVREILSSPWKGRCRPFQVHRCLIDIRDEVLRGRWGLWGIKASRWLDHKERNAAWLQKKTLCVPVTVLDCQNYSKWLA